MFTLKSIIVIFSILLLAVATSATFRNSGNIRKINANKIFLCYCESASHYEILYLYDVPQYLPYVASIVHQMNQTTMAPGLVNLFGRGPRGCPLCDSSVYTYCSHRKLSEDAACCNGIHGPHCLQYLHANSCYEHTLIVTCCCNNPYPYRY